MLRIALVDDHTLFREGLRALLGSQADLATVGEASHAREAFLVIERTVPDVVILDMSLPGSSGVTVARELSRRSRSRVLMLTMHAGLDFVAQAMAAGASGYALKHQPAQEIFEAIRAVARGQLYLAPGIPHRALSERLQSSSEIDQGPLGLLTTREREVFELIVQSYSNQGIASYLCISQKTVETHRSNINRKLGVHSTGELIRLAALHGLVRD